MIEKEFEQTLRKKLDALPAEIKPDHDLWTGIASAIDRHEARTGNRFWWYALAASTAVIGIATWLSFVAPDTDLNSEILQTANELSIRHENQKQSLLKIYSNLQPLTDNWQQQLAELEKASETIRKALSEEPGNIGLLKKLQQVNRQQIHLINTVHRSI